MHPAVKVQVLSPQQRLHALDLVCTEFCLHSPLHKALGVSSSEYRAHLEPDWDEYVSSEKSITLAALSTVGEKLLGCLIATPYPTKFRPLHTIPTKLQPVSALLKQLEQQHARHPSFQTARRLLVDIAVVRQSHRKTGIYSSLRRALHQVALNQGYERVIGELSAAATQRFCIEGLQHTVAAEIQYNRFNHEGNYPFQTIKSPTDIKLVEGIL